MQRKNNKTQASRYLITILTLFSLIFIYSNCKQTETPPKDLSKLNWIIGHWKINEGNDFETWTKINDQYYFGRNFRIYGEVDTVIQETIDLVILDKEILYIPTDKTPKGNRQVPFKMISDSNKYFIFENKQNNFPKKISYTKFDQNTIRARIEGGKRKVDFQFVRIE
jgi:hypothetical protein